MSEDFESGGRLDAAELESRLNRIVALLENLLDAAREAGRIE